MSVNANLLQEIKDSATRMRINSLKSTNAANSGHPTSCSSIAEIMAVLFVKEMKYFVESPRHPLNDRFILSKGHAAPILYAAWADVGLINSEDLLKLRNVNSDLEGHPTPRLNFVDVATGSLGQGLSVACGMAYCALHIDKLPYRVYCVLGDGETAEGSVWEALSFASHYALDNLVAVFDINRLGQSQPTAFGHDLEVYRARLEAFGWHAIVVADGHSVEQLVAGFDAARNTRGRPTALLCKTFKGAALSPEIADQVAWHGKPIAGDKFAECVRSLEATLKSTALQVKPTSPTSQSDGKEKGAFEHSGSTVKLADPPAYKLGDQVATRAAYGTALAKLGRSSERVIGLDGDTKNSTMAQKLLSERPNQFIECFIAEQNMIGVAIGLGCRERAIPFVSAFAAFLTRGADQIRMGAVSQMAVNFVGTHVGVSIGEDGPSQMALEDLAMFRALPRLVLFYPSDAVSAERAVELAANQRKAATYIRCGRPNHPVIYANDELFEVGKAKIVHCSSASSSSSTPPAVTIVGAGVTLHEAIKASQLLQSGGDAIPVRVIDPFTVKPIDVRTLAESVAMTQGRIVVVEDHYYEGGLGEAVKSALLSPAEAGTATPAVSVPLKMRHLAVRDVPRSGKPQELLELFQIDSKAIVQAVRSLI